MVDKEKTYQQILSMLLLFDHSSLKARFLNKLANWWNLKQVQPLIIGYRLHVFEFDKMSEPYPSPSMNYKSNEQAYLYKCVNCGISGETLIFGSKKYRNNLDYALAGNHYKLKYKRMVCSSVVAPCVKYVDLYDFNCLVNRNKLFSN